MTAVGYLLHYWKVIERMIHTIVHEAGFIKVVTAGVFDLAEAQRSFLNVIHAIIINKSDKILFDGTGVTGTPDQLERVSYGEFVARMCLRFLSRKASVPRFAYVLGEPVLDPGRLGEKAATCGGMCVKAFDNFHDAHAWLVLPGR